MLQCFEWSIFFSLRKWLQKDVYIYEVGYFDIGTSVEESVDGCKKGNNFGRLGQKGAVSAGQAGRTNIYLSADKSKKMHCNSRLVWVTTIFQSTGSTRLSHFPRHFLNWRYQLIFLASWFPDLVALISIKVRSLLSKTDSVSKRVSNQCITR